MSALLKGAFCFSSFWVITGLASVGILATLAESGRALAQGSSSAASSDPSFKKRTRTDAQGRKITVVDFDEAHIEGKAKAPEGFVLQSRGSANFKNILELRKNFQTQIQASSADAVPLISPPAAETGSSGKP